MDFTKKLVPSEAIYFISVTQDVFAQLESFLTQLNKYNNQKENYLNKNEVEIKTTLEKKMNRILHERLPKLFQQIWQEICVAVVTIISTAKENLDKMLTQEEKEKIWKELSIECTQLSFFKSIYKFIMFIISSRGNIISNDINKKIGEENNNNNNNNLVYKRILQILKLRDKIQLISDVQHLGQWMNAFVKQLLFTVVSCDINNNYNYNSISVSISYLEESIELYKGVFREFKSPPSPQRKQEEEKLSQQEPNMYRRISIPLINLDISNELYENDERIQYEHLKIFRITCVSLAEDLINFVKHEILSKKQQEQQLQMQQVSSTKLLNTTKINNVVRKENITNIIEVANNNNNNNNETPLYSDKSYELSSGEDRWVFFRIYPNNTPPLTINEVKTQIIQFYNLYNNSKLDMAETLAEGYGEEYPELFDALEYRYCFTSPNKVSQELISSIKEITENGNEATISSSEVVKEVINIKSEEIAEVENIHNNNNDNSSSACILM